MASRADNLSTEFIETLPNYSKHDMQFYDIPTGITMNLIDLERSCVERLKILGMVQRISEQNDQITPQQSRQKLVREMRKNELTRWADLCEGKGHDDDTTELVEARKIDNITHNTVCMVFANEPVNREWFAGLENFFFRWRLEALDERGILAFRKINNMNYPELNEDEKKSWKMDILALLKDPSLFESKIFYKVPFEDVTELLRERNICIERGTAYIDELQFRSVIHKHFQRRLYLRLEESFLDNQYRMADERMIFLGEYLRKIPKILRHATWDTDKISINDLDELAETSYPPCMRQLHEALNKNQHLRNGGRVQYTLFLKSIGLSAKDALEFYEKIFTKKFTQEEFQKEYSYQFRHMYGLVGAKRNYQLKNCCNLANENFNGPHEYHGCYFASGDIENIGKSLERWKIPSSHVQDIVEFQKSKNYEKACSAYFSAVHDCPTYRPIVNPKDYFGQSRKIRKSREDDPFYDDPEIPGRNLIPEDDEEI